MWRQLRRVLVRPREAIAEQPRALGGPLALAFALGVVAVSGALVPALVVARDQLPGAVFDSPTVTMATGDGTVAIPVTVLQGMWAGLVAPVFTWLFVAALLHGLTGAAALAGRARREQFTANTSLPTRSSLADRVDAARRTLVAVGWGLGPQLLASIATGVLFVTGALLHPDLQLRAAQFTPVGHTLVETPDVAWLTAATHVVGGLSVVWTAAVWVGGLQATRSVSRRVAVAVVVPVAVGLLYLSDLVGHLGLTG